tara:strand:+ start:137 stop:1051 length:915 start_codon:yes stop_codon:yes gene_type:complete
MATTTNISSSYVGEFASDYVSAMLLSGNTLSNGLIEIKPNVKYKETLTRLELDGLVADASCDFADVGTLNWTERTIEPKSLQVNIKLCKSTFRSTFEAGSMGASAHDNFPAKLSDFIIGKTAAKIAQATELAIWGGTAVNGSFAGFTTLLAADAAHTGSQKITGEAITPANILTELGSVIDAIPEKLLQDEGLYVYVANNVYRAYKRALANTGGSVQGNNQDIDVQMFDGIKIVPVNGLASNKMISSIKDNLFFATSLLSDLNEVRVIDTSETLGDQNVRFIARYTAAVNYAVVEDIVSYGLGL